MDTRVAMAMAVAAAAHAGQKDAAGADYIAHPLRLAATFEDPALKAVALLHDTAEDSDIELAHLTSLGFDAAIVEAVDALTRRPGSETYLNYIRRLKTNPMAKAVKLADLADNMDPSRWEDEPARGERFMKTHREKYEKAKAVLEAP